MTGTDPAVEAAQRALPPYGPAVVHERDLKTGIAAIREALAPIRELHKPFHHYSPNADYACVNCSDDQGDPEPWPCPTAQLIYTSEELTND
ncbi:hypothetical protein PP301_gp077 [Gordonia phage GMA2]|uniref:Uncharacterized protein n=1 Tax=Gordonia phage GMA2 TaxID=1647283 RepID=A0A0K0N734_9CAUD|nr:hypothetical protein PP301_gp077 [Gordonia phage GMA2]AKJ72645.1 hypothetical protein GMA2_107 [Gordonia phage GMA2]